MTDPGDLKKRLDSAEDAFDHATGRPRFEPGIDYSPDASDGKVSIQKACRLLQSASKTQAETDFYTSVVEESFAIIERTIEGYLLLYTGDEADDLMDHTTPYERAKHHAPLEESTVTRIQGLYDDNRTSTYYGTSVATEQQAEAMLELARVVHSRLVLIDPDLERCCLCEDR